MRSDAPDAVAPRALPVRAVLFDLDGTLADTAPDLAAALNRVRADLGLGPLPYDELRPHASAGARGMLGAGCDVRPGDTRFEPLRAAFLDHYARHLCVHSTLFDGVEAVLDAIEARGLAWGIVTNKHRRYTDPLVVQLGLTPRTRVVISGDTTAHAKPHPAPLLEAAVRLALPPGECLYVGDAERDIEAGNAAGMATLVASYGYIQADETPRSWPAAGAIATPRDLLDWLPG